MFVEPAAGLPLLALLCSRGVLRAVQCVGVAVLVVGDSRCSAYEKKKKNFPTYFNFITLLLKFSIK